jgi:hypothetical protein
VKGGFGKHVFLMLSLVKMYVYLKYLGKVVKIRVFM